MNEQPDAAAECPRWRPADGVIWQASGDSVFVLPTAVRDPRPLRLDGGGAVIWEAIAGNAPSTEDELVAEISHHTGEPTTELRPVVTAFLSQLRSASLVAAA